jgi:hypothetical protein
LPASITSFLVEAAAKRDGADIAPTAVAEAPRKRRRERDGVHDRTSSMAENLVSEQSLRNWD